MVEKLSVIIVNYNLESETRDCLETLITGVQYENYEVVVVENGSEQPLSEGLLNTIQRHENVVLHRVSRNRGFGSGCNAGAALATGTVLCFLNPDTRATSDFVSGMMGFLSRNPDAAVAAPRSDKRRMLDFSAGLQPTLWLELCAIFLIGRYIEAMITAARRGLNADRGIEVGWVVGACLFIRTSVFRQVGGFDEEYFLYFEEVDLCRRVANAGYKCMYYPASYVFHKGSVSGRKDYEMFTRRFYEGKRLFFDKHFPSLYGRLMRAALFCQIVAQIVTWFVLRPIRHQKAAAKLRGFTSLLKAGTRS